MSAAGSRRAIQHGDTRTRRSLRVEEKAGILQGLLGAATLLKQTLAVSGALAVAGVAYAGGCALLKVPEFSQTLRILRR